MNAKVKEALFTFMVALPFVALGAFVHQESGGAPAVHPTLAKVESVAPAAMPTALHTDRKGVGSSAPSLEHSILYFRQVADSVIGI